MRGELKEFVQRWAISMVAVLAAARIMPGIRYDHWTDLLVATLLLGVLNSVLRPLLLLLSLPLLIVTLGLFTLLINAGLLYLVHLIIPGFHVETFWSAVFGALIISVVTLFLNTVTGTGQARVQFRRGRRPPPPGRRDGDDGPVIDV
jgi:putative membrane protein